MIYRFGDMSLDTDKVELWRDDERVPLEPQVFALLRLLLERRERLVSKDELIEEIWEGRAVSDSALSSRIKSARQALGDDGARQQWIRTQHKKGFRFVGNVEVECEIKLRGGYDPALRLLEVMSRPMVVVLPFAQQQVDARDAYFVDGLAEDLMARLACWGSFPVLSRNAAFDRSREAVPLPRRAAELGASYAVSGHIHRLDETARLTIELVEVETGAQLWSAKFERDRDGLLQAQAQIAADVCQRLAPELDSAERRRILRKSPGEMTAWDLSHKALWTLNQVSETDLTETLHQLETATRLDPALSMPWSLISLIRFEAALKGWVAGQFEHLGRLLGEMLAAARTAIDLDPKGWMGHALAGAGELWSGCSYARARRHAEMAIELNPSAALAHHMSGCVYGFGGDLQAAVLIQAQATRMDPHYRHADAVEADLGLWHFLMGEFRQAREHLESALAENPGNLRARQRMVALLGSMQEPVAARAELDRLVDMGDPMTSAHLAASYPFQRPEHTRLLATGLHKAGVVLA